MPTLNWIGKEKVLNHHIDVPFRVLKHIYSFNGKDVEKEIRDSNMIIHGDNLLSLKALLPQFEGKVDVCYIDPPYNTGNENWIYNDNVNDPKIQKWLGEVVGQEGEDFCRHDKWLCMMYPRLKLISKLLSVDGSIVISISHHELNNLIAICRDIFERKQIVIATVQTSGGKPRSGFNYTNEYLVFIVPENIRPNPSEDLMNSYASPYHAMTLATFNQEERPNQTYPIYVNELTCEIVGVGLSLDERIKKGLYSGEKKDFIFTSDGTPANCVSVWPISKKNEPCVWRLIPSRLIEDYRKGYINVSKDKKGRFSIGYLSDGIISKIENGEFEISHNENGTVIVHNFKTGGVSIPTLWLDKNYYTTNGGLEIKSIFGTKEAFSYPKPTKLIRDILQRITSKDSIILDSFAGSGTTGHAVLKLNAEDGGNRKFILCEMGDYANTITAERIKRVINGVDSDNSLFKYNSSFNYYELGEALFTEDGLLNENISEEKIREYVYYTETRQPLTRPRVNNSFLLDTFNNTGFYFYYKPNELTTFGPDTLKIVTEKADSYVVYADKCTLSEDYMLKHNIVFKKIPRDIKQF